MDQEEKPVEKSFELKTGNVLLVLPIVICTLIICRVVYKFIRSKFPITVNCWFCNKNTSVPYDAANSWDCPHCEQYNGFTHDGNYNKEIQAQYEPSLNNKTHNLNKSAFCPSTNSQSLSKNGLCDICNINQELKVQQLANFVPINEENYDYEIEQYSRKLEKSYELCQRCQNTLDATIKYQTYNILKDRLNFERIKSQSRQIIKETKVLFKFNSQSIKSGLLTFLRVVSSILNSWLLLSYVYILYNANSSLNKILSLFNLSNVWMFGDVKTVIGEWLLYSQTLHRELSGLTFTLFLLSSYGRQFRVDFICLLLCALQHGLSWTGLQTIQVITSSLTTTFNMLSVLQKQFYIKKHVISNETVDNFKFMYDANIKQTNTTQNIVPGLTAHNTVMSANEQLHSGQEFTMRLGSITSGYFTRSKANNRLNEIQKRNNDSDNESELSFFTSKTSRRRKRYMSPPPEDLFTNLNSLHLDTNNKHVDIDTECKQDKNIIKPSKFLKSKIDNWVTAGTWGSDEPSPTRSSTPSSGYTSQSSQKIEPENQPNKSINTINPFLKSPDFYNTERQSVYCSPTQSPQYLPMFSPIGPQTTVYTYTTPPGYRPYQYMYPWNSSANSVDTSVENKSACSVQTVHNEDKWSKFKQCLYNTSVVLNILSFFIVMYGVYIQCIKGNPLFL